MTESKKDAPFQLPPFHVIEEEGRKAADELAQEFLRETLADGGRLDLRRLGRAGPTVQSAYMRLLSEVALQPTNGPRNRTQAAAKTQPPKSTKPPVASSTIKREPLRTEVGWADRQRPDAGFAAHAFRRGLITAALLGSVVVLAAHLLHL